MANPESFDTTHERLRELLVGTSPAEAAGQLLAQGHAPLHVLHALVTETKPAVVGALDELIREKAAGPLNEAYEAYVALQTAKASAPGHTIDRDGYAVGAAERAGHGREAMGQALPYVVDLPDPSVDRQAVASLLLVPDVASSVYDRQALVGYAVVTPLVSLWATDRDRSVEPTAAPVGPDPGPPKLELLAAQLAALDADRHQVVVRGPDGGIQYLARSRDGERFTTVDRPTTLTNDQVLAAFPMMERLNATANIDLVSESVRHHYLVLQGLDAGQARDLDRFGANLVMRVGDEHMAVVRLPEDPSRAQTVAILLRARYPDRPDDPSTPAGPPFAIRDGGVELVKARAEDILPASPRDRATSASTNLSSPAEAIERFVAHRSTALQASMDSGFGLEPARIDRNAARSLLADGYGVDQVVGAVQFASTGLGGGGSNLEAYAKRVVETALHKEGPVERVSPPDVGGR